MVRGALTDTRAARGRSRAIRDAARASADITEAGTHDKVAALVYITAFAPDQGESVNTLLGTFPVDGPKPPILPPVNG
jgi:hypothetical protein